MFIFDRKSTYHCKYFEKLNLIIIIIARICKRWNKIVSIDFAGCHILSDIYMSTALCICCWMKHEKKYKIQKVLKLKINIEKDLYFCHTIWNVCGHEIIDLRLKFHQLLLLAPGPVIDEFLELSDLLCRYFGIVRLV